jgi:hypothetical protein
MRRQESSHGGARINTFSLSPGTTLRYKKKTPPVPCVTVPLNLLETGGTRRVAFDFQSRPVGYNRDSDPVSYLLRFKDIVSNHVHRQGKSSILEKIVLSRLEFVPKNRRAQLLASLLRTCEFTVSLSSRFLKKKIVGILPGFLYSVSRLFLQPVLDSGQELLRVGRFRDIFVRP